ncbi:hypothetical protein [Microlunatus parietis]|uniref:DUF4434 domain-containing protein n=1 Tax=Microlunatus parietis TaxID=682979 RepID=A0A7Y9IBI7_9ACTN|nr:hypothetical protein [Microlunatus parietis]NYE73893.1 hypothetical protein [Microlunatus parietis]
MTTAADRSRLPSRVVIMLLLLLTLIIGLLPPGSARADEPAPEHDRCGDLPEPGPGVVTGFFTYYESDPCRANRKLAAVRAAGGDTMITFGFRLQQRRTGPDGAILAADGSPDPRFACTVDGLSCTRAAAGRIGAGTLRRVLTYSGTERFGAAMLRCPHRDRSMVSGGIRFQLILLPVGTDRGCRQSHDQYDLVLINTGAPDAVDPVTIMLRAAAAQGVSLFLGMPRPDMNPASPWLADVTYLDTVQAFTRRVFTDWRDRHTGLGSLGGLYQSVEMPLKGNPAWDDQYALYGTQHALARAALPDLPVLLSPYIDARPRMTSPVSGVPLAITRMIESGHGAKIIIAPQDGRGTGKGGVFFPDEADQPVPERLEPVVGGPLTYREAYSDSSAAYFRAAAETGRPFGADRFELWANVELMEPAPLPGEPACSSGTARGLATADRVMKQVAVVGNTVTKVIGFDWDQMMECRVPGRPTLREHLRELGDRPAPTGLLAAGDDHPGLLLTGYHLDRADVTVSYQDASGALRSRGFPFDPVRFEPDLGASRPQAYPPGIQGIRLPWRPADLAPDRPWLSFAVTGPAGEISYQRYTVLVPTA